MVCNKEERRMEGLPGGRTAYIILRLLAKTALAWMIFAGSLATV
jgi:hypothetical protein